MYNFLLTVHILSVLLMIGFILLQKSESGGLVSSSGVGGLMSARGTANFFTRATGILAAVYFATALLLAVIAGGSGAKRAVSLLDKDPLAVQVPMGTTPEPVDYTKNVKTPTDTSQQKPALATRKQTAPTG